MSDVTTTEDKPAVFDSHAAPTFTLCVVFSGEQAVVPPQTHVLRRGATPLGRDVGVGISLPGDRRLSRVQATIHNGPDGTLRIIDERSRNGTYVNGRRVSEALLADGDVIGAGDSYFIMRAVPRRMRDAPVRELLGVSPAIRASRAALALAAPTEATVLLLAATGCGKEVAARTVHELSGRRGPFVAVNCSAIPESLAESLLFGQLAAAYTGAPARPGLFRAAHGGTLFLDEIGDLPLAIQPKILRALEERKVTPLGSTPAITVDVRIVAATNRDLQAGIAGQQFRSDLYARLAQFEVRLPPLVDRREDILLLLLHALGAPAPRLTPRLVDALLLHRWPFNVRELFAVAQQLRISALDEDLLDVESVATRFARGTDSHVEQAGPIEAQLVEREDVLPPDRAGLEALLRAHHGVVSDVARTVNRSRKQVYRWISNHAIDVKRYRGDGS